MSRKVLVDDDAGQFERVLERLKRLEQSVLGVLPAYNNTNLPTDSPDNTLAIVDMPGGFRSLIVKNDAIGGASSWVVLTPHPIVGTGTPSTFTSTAAAQWNKPATTTAVTLPFGGSYRLEGVTEALTGIAQSIIGIGASLSSAASTSNPSVIGTSGEDLANFRVQIALHPNRITGVTAGDVWDLRFFMNTIATMQFARTSLWAWPVYINGVV